MYGMYKLMTVMLMTMTTLSSAYTSPSVKNVGITPPFKVIFDPLKFSYDVKDSEVSRLRESELKHGRWAMISAASIPLIESVTPGPAIHAFDNLPINLQLSIVGAITIGEFTSMLRGYKNPFEKETNGSVEFLIVGDFLWHQDNNLAAISKKVKFVGRKSGKELCNLVANSLAMVYVSYFEGFGIPVLEGMKSGVPVVTSNVSSIPEVGGDAVVYIDPFSIDSIKKGMVEASNKENFIKYRNKGLIQAEKFSWEKSAKIIWSVIRSEIEKID